MLHKLIQESLNAVLVLVSVSVCRFVCSQILLCFKRPAEFCRSASVCVTALRGPICINSAALRSDNRTDAGPLTGPRRGFIDPRGLQPTRLSGLTVDQWGVM